ncbi:MAG: aa3-type cytochrome c oxidase subunit IV [Pseudomonadota bacterium]
MAEHEENEAGGGKMDITAQEKTFEGFLKACAIVAIITVAILIFLAIVGT